MSLLKKSLNNVTSMKTYEVLLFVVLVLYLVSGVSTPYSLAPYVNNVFMHLSLIALVVVSYLYGKNVVLTLFLAIVAFVFVNRSSKVSHIKMKPSEDNKKTNLKSLNKHLSEKTLEEEVVGQVIKNVDNSPNPSSYNPVLCDSHNAGEV